ncbi:MAG: glutamate-1-semialdehyde 2,1-aminomutase [Francisellaceae bacterium]|nr:glutamate-1-semialdehyde 2,1-aminomutase [Francisellaceae bacterium]MBT6539356.1 glutamate-1-semialdehyde 2,1-aminomutase [Francisellaceae bacterium]
MISFNKSIDLYSKAKKLMPGGVNSPVRSFNHVDIDPIYLDSGNGAYVFDVDGNKYIDYVNCWGALLLGHSHPDIVKNVTTQIQKNMGQGACSPLEVEIASLINEIMPSCEKIRMVNSGTEATMTAIRLARGYTGRNKVIKFSGCYHGHHDSLLVKAGSGVLTLNLPDSPGIPKELTQHTLIAPFNDIEHTKQLFDHYGSEIACVIVEPIAANMNVILPKEGFLNSLQKLCHDHSSLLIADEVITGFRVSLGGAQEQYKFKADLTCLGKIIGGGLPVGALGGRKEIMDHLAPIGSVYQAGTLSGNPVALAAGIAALQYCKNNPNLYTECSNKIKMLSDGITAGAKKHGFTINFVKCGALFGMQIESDPSHKIFRSLFTELLAEGIYIAPSPYEATMMSTAHSTSDIEFTVNGFTKAFAKISKKGDLNVSRVKVNREPTTI